MDETVNMTARPQDVALLPLPWCLLNLRADDRFAVQDYARANVTAALASAQAREDELRVALTLEKAGAEHERIRMTCRIERLEEALREARDYVASELSDERAKFAGYEHCSSIASIEADLARIDAALSPNAATQTGETT